MCILDLKDGPKKINFGLGDAASVRNVGRVGLDESNWPYSPKDIVQISP
jgi:hypothetical protein